MDDFFWFALKSVPLVGNVTFRRLLERFGSPAAVLGASERELSGIPGVNRAAVGQILSANVREDAERHCEALRRSGARLVHLLSPEYPPLLLQIPDAPPFLYVKGDLAGADPAVAVVGARRASSYGIQTTGRLARDLAERGVAVVSGMARGIDTAAHRGALAAGGRSIGVLGCGIDVVYPPENSALFAEMADRGALVSEFPPGTQPLAENFPRRNRIISGIARGVLVVEAMEGSGSLITAQFALDQGRDVYAVPGNITSASSRGTNRLIAEGARLVTGVDDIVQELAVGRRAAPAVEDRSRIDLDPEEEKLIASLAVEPLHIDAIIQKTALTVGVVSAMLLRLELKGVIKQLPGKYFAVS